MHPSPDLFFDLIMCFFTFGAGAAPELIDIQQISKKSRLSRDNILTQKTELSPKVYQDTD